MAKKKEKIPDIQGELIEQLIRESGGPQALFNKGGLLDMLKKRLIEKCPNPLLLGHGVHKLFVKRVSNVVHQYRISEQLTNELAIIKWTP
ncbi:MAG: hypothetical protein WCK32_10265 [Chlorobiaceae bacterium]